MPPGEVLVAAVERASPHPAKNLIQLRLRPDAIDDVAHSRVAAMEDALRIGETDSATNRESATSLREGVGDTVGGGWRLAIPPFVARLQGVPSRRGEGQHGGARLYARREGFLLGGLVRHVVAEHRDIDLAALDERHRVSEVVGRHRHVADLASGLQLLSAKVRGSAGQSLEPLPRANQDAGAMQYFP